MPTFRTSATPGLATSIRNLIAGAGSAISPIQAMQVDHLAAQTAHSLGLAEKARQEAENMRLVQSRQADPNLRTEYAAHAAGIDMPAASRLVGAIRGAIEQPGPADVADAAMVGADAQPFPMARPNLQPGQERVFRSALASTIGNLIATGKTNAEQLAHATDRTNATALVSDAANAPDVPTGNRIIAAVSGRLREPFKTNAQGTVLNEETGALDESGRLADEVRKKLTAEAGKETAQATTEGARQTELRARAGRNTAQAGLAGARAEAVRRGETGKGGQRVTPEQVERWVSEVARKEWDTIPASSRRGMNYDQHLAKVRERFKPTAANAGGAAAEVTDAQEAIRKGADAKKVRERFRQRMGFDLPEASTDDEEE